jgi:hypothetical protein
MDCRLSGHLAKAVCSKLNSGKLNTAHFKHSMPVLGEGLLDSRNLSRDCDPVCSDHDSPADDREAQAHEEVRMPDCSLRRVDSHQITLSRAETSGASSQTAQALVHFRMSVSRSLWDLNSSRLYISPQKTFSSSSVIGFTSLRDRSSVSKTRLASSLVIIAFTYRNS